MAAFEMDATRTVLGEVRDERTRQDAKWGEQNHPDGTGPDIAPFSDMTVATPSWCYLDAAELAEMSREDCAAAFTIDGAGPGTYRHILLEEVFEALAEADPEVLRGELIQVAAVAVAWVEAIDRRQS